ncbi:MAG: orotidine-5'-phosphate decarboxylase [Bacteroidales bacterium]|jgi:orotidine-5'-phosphate decarboxylase|nr:orotidine-5'-phosphate decarboxylase [Bacteroidales bacterium]NCU35524.1 orotidine-5'-phosphate decarboxylase [Candidatus Falkowbacteria bacterium]MDD2632997.1 orotidine-5'-phosphate decarboxylase [Bacteroidales bacterium]MDD3130395.1 orotidine-5'-phosphate decarboxylase [Bacteroidales bacterium]MDD3527228.1 orotidine-5'-phosphate decarboxylase [Bacteroidales bacterium]
MNRQQLLDLIRHKQSILCIGLDSDLRKIPHHLLTADDPIFEFNRQIIDATHHLAIAYKPNVAFYESQGSRGWRSLERTIEYLATLGDNIFTIADAKRGDIGNTSGQYARAFLAAPPDGLGFDAITVAPYMGSDSVVPFLSYHDKWVILLALTSNSGADDFETQLMHDGRPLYEQVLRVSQQWGDAENMMYVVGATRPELLGLVRKLVPDHFLLVPGVGAQGGSLQEVCRHGLTPECGLIINSSREIIFASAGMDFAKAARQRALTLHQQMQQELDRVGAI